MIESTFMQTESEVKVLKGMNLSGMSDRGDFYHPPTAAHIDYWWNKGLHLVRYPIYWERLQELVKGAFATSFWAEIQAAVDYAVGKGMEVIVNLHCMGQRDVNGTVRRIGNQELPFDALADFWLKVNAVYKGNTKVHYDLMNEPNGLPSTSYSTSTASAAYLSGTEALIACFNYVTAHLRANGSQNLLIFEGNGYNNAKTWTTDNWYGTSNSTAFGGSSIVDPLNKWTVSVHNYPDAKHGQGGVSIHRTILRKQMGNVVAWAQANSRRVFCGEFGAIAADPDGEYNTRDFITFLNDNKQHVYGWCWWQGRPAATTTSGYNIPPDAGSDDVRLAWLDGTPNPVKAAHPGSR